MAQCRRTTKQRRDWRIFASLGLLVLATCSANDRAAGGSTGTTGVAGEAGDTGSTGDEPEAAPTADPSAEEACRAYCDHDIEMCVDIDDDFDDLGYCYQDCEWYSDVDAGCDQAGAALFACLSTLSCEELDDFWGEVGEYPCKAEEGLETAACPG